MTELVVLSLIGPVPTGEQLELEYCQQQKGIPSDRCAALELSGCSWAGKGQYAPLPSQALRSATPKMGNNLMHLICRLQQGAHLLLGASLPLHLMCKHKGCERLLGCAHLPSLPARQLSATGAPLRLMPYGDAGR